MVKLTSTLQRLEKTKVLVAGDLMLDAYTIGKAKRISPEAPVAVIHVQKEEHRPGGAGNVMLNVLSLGAEVVALGRVGEDKMGQNLLNALKDEGVDIRGILVQAGYPTPVKNRIIAENQQIVRIDHELLEPLSESLEQKLIKQMPVLLQGVKIVAISDYGKGLLSPLLLKELIRHARALGIPVIADPKGIDFIRYAGATVIKPNLSEAYAAARLSHESPLEEVAKHILMLAEIDALMVTRSEAGISVFKREGVRSDFPVRAREVKDVTGAGDTVLAMLSCAMANGLSLEEAAQLSNVAAGIAIERFGCARVTLSDIAKSLLEDHSVNKIFDEEHLFALKQALNGRYRILIHIDGSLDFSPFLFKALQQVSKRQDGCLMIYLSDPEQSEELERILASLSEVDFIIRKSHATSLISECLYPDEAYRFKNNQLEHV